MAELGRRPDETEYEVIEDARKGFLGLGARLVKIRVVNVAERIPPDVHSGYVASHEPEPPSRKGKPRPAPSTNASYPPAREPGSKRGPATQRSSWNRGQDGGRGSRSGSSQPSRRGPRGGDSGRGPGNRKDGPPPGNRRDEQVSGQRGADRASRTRWTEERPSEPSISPADAARAARLPDDAVYSKVEAVRAAAGPLLRAMNLELRAKLRDRDGAVVLDLAGEDASRLLENDGEGLDALQHILNKILARDERFASRLVVDCDGFRVHHDQEIIDRATKAAQEAQATGKAVHLEDLNAYERRLIHVTLADDARVRTYSTGEGAIKRLTIEPLDQPPPEA